MEFPGGWELVLIVVAGVALFGAKRLPDSARAVGRSLRILKAETKGLRDDEPAASAPAPAQPLPVPEAVPPAQPLPPVAPVLTQPVQPVQPVQPHDAAELR